MACYTVPLHGFIFWKWYKEKYGKRGIRTLDTLTGMRP